MKTTYNLSALLCLSVLLGLGAPVLRAQNGPPAPTGLQASDGEYPDQVALFWNNAEAIWEVYRGTQNDPAQAEMIGIAFSNDVLDDSVTPGTLYYYWVKAVDDFGSSPFSQGDSGYAGILGGGGSTNRFRIEILAPNGRVNKNPDQPDYTAGTQVTLTAVPDPGYRFSQWYGDVTGSQNPVTLTIQGPTQVEAVFETSGSSTNDPGHGLITDAPNGRIAREPHMEFYPHGTQVRLTAIPDPGYRFDHWEHDASGTNNPYVLTITQPSTVQAIFVPGSSTNDPGHGLITDAPNGRIAREPDMEFYPHGTQVRLTAIPDPGYHFDHWEYDASGTNNPYVLTITQPSTVQAIFVPGTDPGPGPSPQPKIQIALHAGIAISGQTGRRYLIQASPDLTQTNAWTQIGEITLTNATQTWYDPTPARHTQRTYRVIAAP